MRLASGAGRTDVMVVIACIPFIVLVLEIVATQGRRGGMQAVCMIKQRHLGLGMLEYLNDNNGYFMAGSVGHNGQAVPGRAWFEAIEQYVSDENDVRCCPAATAPMYGLKRKSIETWCIDEEAFGADPTGWGYRPGSIGSYGLNGYMYALPVGRIDEPAAEMTTPTWRTICVSGSGRIPVLADGTWLDGRPKDSDIPPAADEGWSGGEMGVFCIDRHHKSINCLFLDMSVQKVMLWRLWELKWSRDFNTCNDWTECGGADVNDFPEWMRPDEIGIMDKSIWELSETGMFDKTISELLGGTSDSEPLSDDMELSNQQL